MMQATGMLTFVCCDVWQQAAEILKVKPTTIKKICRNFNIIRWPYRKVRSVMHILPFSYHPVVTEDDVLFQCDKNY
jgi:hypothetical protein